MSQTQRLGIVVVAVVLAVAAFVLFKPDDEPATRGSDPTNADQPPAAVTPPPTETARPKAPPSQPPAERVNVRGGAPVGGVQKVATRKGELVRLVFSSDVADEIHLHGYDITRPVGPGRDARFRFKATIEGVFEVELEQRGVEVARLEVRP